MDPILFVKYPKEMEMILGNMLPKFSSNDKVKLGRGLDFIGINYYAGFYVRDCISSVCGYGKGVSRTEGLYELTVLKNGVPIGELVSTFNFVYDSRCNLLIQKLYVDSI